MKAHIFIRCSWQIFLLFSSELLQEVLACCDRVTIGAVMLPCFHIHELSILDFYLLQSEVRVVISDIVSAIFKPLQKHIFLYEVTTKLLELIAAFTFWRWSSSFTLRSSGQSGILQFHNCHQSLSGIVTFALSHFGVVIMSYNILLPRCP